jgi:hypothetical protein
VLKNLDWEVSRPCLTYIYNINIKKGIYKIFPMQVFGIVRWWGGEQNNLEDRNAVNRYDENNG